MQQNQWNTQKIKQYEQRTGQKLIQDKQVLEKANQDFGHLRRGHAAAVFQADTLSSLQDLLRFASSEQLPLTIRSHGLSQSGQSLSPPGCLSLDIGKLNTQVQWVDDRLIAGASASWASVVNKALERNKIPRGFPYNMDLSIGGVLSVGGLGASSFKEGIIASHVDELGVLTASGDFMVCNQNEHQDLLQACLSGAGLFGIIYHAALALRACKPNVRVQTLIYDNPQYWIEDQFFLRPHCDYLEAFLTLEGDKKTYTISFAVEFEQVPPILNFIHSLRFADIGSQEDKPLKEYIHRHAPRLNNMKTSRAWTSFHPWYECYVDSRKLLKKLDEIVDILAESLGGLYHIFPVAHLKPKYFMLPQAEQVVTFNILSPGIEEDNLPSALNSLKRVDEIMRAMGGKRYISGWFDESTNQAFWQEHYGDLIKERQAVKAKYDPANLFRSQLFATV